MIYLSKLTFIYSTFPKAESQRVTYPSYATDLLMTQGLNTEAVALIHADRVVWFTWPSPPILSCLHYLCPVFGVNSRIQTVDPLHAHFVSRVYPWISL